ncbi:MAG: DNA polymerase III subunit epsilon [Proteobacteria bacterium]|nr:MAG: DNA polymerase III subunit epsilon [Pseudomonadota bacterium]
MIGNWFNLSGRRKQTDNKNSLAAISLDPTPMETRLEHTRFTVLDFETTGLNIRKDVPISIGAVSIYDSKIELGNQFEHIIYQPEVKPGEATLVHGVSPEEIEGGKDLTDALVEFYEYAEHSVFIAFHAPFDKAILSRATKAKFNLQANHQFLDAYDVGVAFFPERGKSLKGLDNWAKSFGLDIEIDRHHASADALMTAELMLIFLSKAQSQGIHTLGQFLRKIEQSQRLSGIRHSI